jgi:hypothetical protein
MGTITKDRAAATVDAACDPENKRLYVAAYQEAAGRVPGLHAMLIETQEARHDLYAAAADPDGDLPGAFERLARAVRALVAQLPLVESAGTSAAGGEGRQPEPAPGVPGAEPLPPQADGGPTKMTWQKAAERLERLRQRGDPFTSRGKLAKQLGCSTFTVHKAIKQTASLQAWAKRAPAKAKVQQGIEGPVLDNTPESREPNPQDEAAEIEVRKVFETAPADERAFLHTLKGASSEIQKWYVSLNRQDREKYRDRWKRVVGNDATLLASLLNMSLEQLLVILDDPDRGRRVYPEA